jgi:hypothetical protein
MIWKTKKREVRRAGSASLLFLSANAVLVAADGGAGSSVSPWCAIVRNKPNRQGPSAGDAGRAVQTNPIRRADHAKQTQFPAAGISPHSTTLLFHHANPVVIVPNKPNFARRPRPRWRDVRNKPNWRVGRAKQTQFLPLCRSGDRRSREAHCATSPRCPASGNKANFTGRSGPWRAKGAKQTQSAGAIVQNEANFRGRIGYRVAPGPLVQTNPIPPTRDER